MKIKNYYDTQDLVELFFEFKKHVPYEINWSEKRLRKRLPHYYRFKQLQALCRAYGVKSIVNLSNGTFIKDSRLYNEFHNRMVFVCILDDMVPRISGFTDISILTHNCIDVHQSILTARNENIRYIANIVCPDRAKIFHKKTLKSEYGFPEVNLIEMDTEYAIF